jgi:hypothetical protein
MIELSAVISVELLSAVPNKPSRNAVLQDIIKEYLIYKPSTPDMSKYHSIATKSFTLRVTESAIANSLEAECKIQLRERSSMLSVMIASVLERRAH